MHLRDYLVKLINNKEPVTDCDEVLRVCTDFSKMLKVFEQALSNKLGNKEQTNFFTANDKGAQLRASLIAEEADEVIEALKEGDAEDVLKELCDLIYVTFGTAVFYGFPIEKAFRRVHENNMLKINNSQFNEKGKLVKPKDHPKVILSDLIGSEHG